MNKRQRNRMSQEIAAKRKSKEHLKMLQPAHVKREAQRLPPAELAIKLQETNKRRLTQKADRQLSAMMKSAFKHSATAFLEQLMAPGSAPSFGQLGGAIFGRSLKGTFRGATGGPISNPVFVVYDDIDSLPSAPRATLSMLAACEPVKLQGPEKPMPDYVECITAWRAWDVVRRPEGPRLCAIGDETIWEPRQPINATCTADSRGFGMSFWRHEFAPRPSHAAPDFDCRCGIWAFKSQEELLGALHGHRDVVKVIGTVSLWGKVVETEHGFRAEHAYPLELYLLNPGLKDLSWIYNVAVRALD